MARFFGLIPAAGVGTRMGASTPKQYMSLGRQSMLAHAIDALLASPLIHTVCVVVAPDDTQDQNVTVDPRVCRAPVGGITRAHSVYNGVNRLCAQYGAQEEDWVLVHDAARPCLSPEDLNRLIDVIKDDQVGGLLASPLSDTLKKAADDARVVATVSRAQLWRAATPQMFRVSLLRQALANPEIRAQATDESAAVERLGMQPLLVAGSSTNIKVTQPQDLALAQAILQIQGRF